MESFFNLKNCGDTPQPAVRGDNSSLPRQNSISSLTFDEFQNTSVGHGKDFGSMNMDELLKIIWTAEETQAVASSCGTAGVEGNLQRQGSLTLPPTLGQKTVDEVWRDLLKESGGGGGGSSGGGSHFQQRQSTLGEMTLEEFLMRTGVVKEEVQSPFYSKQLQPLNNTCLPVDVAMGIQQSADQSNLLFLANSQLAVNRLSPDEIAKTIVDKPSSSLIPHCMYRRGGGSGGGRGRTCGREKLMEQKYNRMMKNRESAARSRARKQAYTSELEAEVTKLREINKELQKKQILETRNVLWGSKRRCLRRTLTGPW